MITLLRSIADVGSFAIDEAQHTVTVREVADKVAIVERLVAVADRKPGEVEVAVDVLTVDPAALDSWLGGGGGAGEAGTSHRLTAGELARFERRTAAAAIARPRLGLVGERPARFSLRGLPLAPDEQAAEREPAGGAPLRDIDPYQVFEIELSGRIHPAPAARADLTLDVKITTRQLRRRSAAAEGNRAGELVAGEYVSSVRLADGATFLVTHFHGGGAGGEPTPPGVVPGVDSGGDRAVVVALTPHVVRQPEPLAADLATLWVGSEALIRFGRGQPLGPRDP